MHYPLFLLNPAEPSNYGNIDEPARSDLLDLIRRHRVEAVFAGHVHNIFYHRLHGTVSPIGDSLTLSQMPNVIQRKQTAV